MRLFVAIDVPEALKEALENDVVAGLSAALPGARWTRPEGRHLTVKFLGNVPDEQIDAVEETLRSAARRHAPFEAAFEELGAFPSLRRPRVLWVGVGPGRERMAALASDLERSFEPLGFEPEGRPFAAHLTLARFAKPRVIGELPAVGVPGSPFPVGEIVLFRSQLHPKGARYEALERATLTGEAR